uniref:ARAD1C33352p n=1 Tax=Blastobotrys adeninivorans TaxID=409370 RepID=A0A060T312_BLAAD
MEKVCDDILDSIKDHYCGIPRLSNSSLSELERQYLNKAQKKLSPRQLDELAKRATLTSYDPKSASSQRIFQLVAIRDYASNKLQQASNEVEFLEDEFVKVSNENSATLDDNRQLSAQLSQQMSRLRVRQRQAFNHQQLDAYRSKLAQLTETDKKLAVLQEFIVAFVASTGLDWYGTDWEQLIMDCGSGSLLATDDFDPL